MGFFSKFAEGFGCGINAMLESKMWSKGYYNGGHPNVKSTNIHCCIALYEDQLIVSGGPGILFSLNYDKIAETKLIQADTLAIVALLKDKNDNFVYDSIVLTSIQKCRSLKAKIDEMINMIQKNQTLSLPSEASFTAFSPEGHILAAGCSDGTVKLWDTTSYTETCTLTGHSAPVDDLAFSPDGH